MTSLFFTGGGGAIARAGKKLTTLYCATNERKREIRVQSALNALGTWLPEKKPFQELFFA
jgi:hypothetical protein